MPEAPEVRRTVDWLIRNVLGCIIRDVNAAGRFKWKPIVDLDKVKNRKVEKIRCKGKVIVMDLEEEVTIISTLGMSGRWTKQDVPHKAITMMCERPPLRGMVPVYYVDQRRFGNFVVTTPSAATTKLDGLGWDVYSEPFTYGKSRVRAKKYSKWKICDVLLRQDVFAGVGNYIRCEAMYRAKLNPDKLLLDISDVEWDNLCRVIVDIVQESYARGGSTLETYVDGDGQRGDHVDFLEVYSKTHDPQGNPVERKKDKTDRTVWWVPNVQT